MKTAVAILNWNGKKHLQEFLPSVIEHTNPEDADIYIIDNASEDDSITYVSNNFPQVKIVQLDRNYGFARGYNEGLRKIHADIYVLLNSDVKVTSNWLKPIIDFMEQNSNIAAVQPKILSYKQPDTFEYAGAAGGFIDKWGYPFARGRIFDEVEKDEGQYDNICSIFWASGAAMFIRAEDYWSVGGFDNDFFAHQEEIDLCWRLKAAGRDIMAFPKVKVYHLGGGTLEYSNPRKIYFNFRNNLMMLTKNLSSKQLPWLILWRLILDGVAALQMLISGNVKGFTNVIKAHFAYYSTLPKTLRKRKKILVSKRFDFPEVLQKSIIWNFYIKKIRTFSKLFG